MRSYRVKTVILFLLIALLLAACGDFTATSTSGPVAESTLAPTPTNTAAATTAPATTKVSTPTPIPNQQITPAPGQLPTTKLATTAAATATPGQAQIVTGQPFQLKMGQTGQVAASGLTIKFASVSEDSRCPGSNGTKMVACAWGGQVTAQLEVKQGSNPVQTISLTLMGTTPPTTVPASAIKNIGDNQLQLLSVEPHPIIDEKINPLDYVATLQIMPGNYQLPSPTAKPATTAPATTKASPTKASPTTPSTTAQPGGTPSAVTKGQPFQLKMNHTAYLSNGDLYVTFLNVTEDSRCPEANGPKSVNCYWAGQVVIELEVRQGNNPPQTLKLNTKGGTGKTEATIGSGTAKFQLQFQSVQPRKVIDVDIQPSEYIVTLQVS